MTLTTTIQGPAGDFLEVEAEVGGPLDAPVEVQALRVFDQDGAELPAPIFAALGRETSDRLEAKLLEMFDEIGRAR